MKKKHLLSIITACTFLTLTITTLRAGLLSALKVLFCSLALMGADSSTVNIVGDVGSDTPLQLNRVANPVVRYSDDTNDNVKLAVVPITPNPTRATSGPTHSPTINEEEFIANTIGVISGAIAGIGLIGCMTYYKCYKGNRQDVLAPLTHNIPQEEGLSMEEEGQKKETGSFIKHTNIISPQTPTHDHVRYASMTV